MSLTEEMQRAPDQNTELVTEATKNNPVATEAEYQAAGEWLVAIGRKKKILLAGDGAAWKGWDAIVEAAKVAYDAATAGRRAQVEPLEKADEYFRDAMKRYFERRAAIEQKDQEQRREAAQLVEQRLRDAAQGLLVQGQVAEAASIEEQADSMALIVATVTASAPPELPGVATIPTETVRVRDLPALLRAIADGTVPMTGRVNGREIPIVEIKDSVLKSLRAAHGKEFAPPGVEFKPTASYRIKT